jgi:hypothetical protein
MVLTIDREIDNGRSNIRKKDIPNEEEEWGRRKVWD